MATSSRLAYLDNLRIVLTVLVIYHHTAITYGATGSWYYVEPVDAGLTGVALTLFVTFNQSFFLGAFYLLSGVFTPDSYNRKGPRRFLLDRGIRLGIPVAVYVLLVSPAVVYFLTVSPEPSFWQYLTGEVWTGQEIRWGPLWFVELLLYFNIGYVAWRLVRDPESEVPGPEPFPEWWVIVAAAVVVGLVGFLVRLVFPVGDAVLGIQPAYLTSYVVLFVVGLSARQRGWLDAVTMVRARRWVPAVVVLVAAMPVLFVLGGALEGGVTAFLGGPTVQSLAYAVWEPLVGFGTIIVLLGVFRERVDVGGPTVAWLSENAYAAYVFHAPVLVATSYGVRNVQAPLIAKFFVIGSVAVTATFLTAAAIARLPFADRVF